MNINNENSADYDVIIIGAGPSGASAAALLRQKGFSVCILEKQHFPRFVIGESLLPHCMSFFEEAGFLSALQDKAQELAFQKKIGAFFMKHDMNTFFDFREKFTPGPAITWQVN
ncbi:NAD(P)-binding protein [Neisseriaceae bacterium PsAf]|nr:NAD(P)-binding protein [Neisseriaceae bacterium PsAf]